MLMLSFYRILVEFRNRLITIM